MKAKQTFRGVVLKSRFPVQSELSRTRMQHTAAPATGPAKVRVGREVSGRGGKAVAVISGLPLSSEALEELATRLKKLCGAGGAVRNGTIEIQGDHRDRLMLELTKLGYEAKRSGG